MPLRQQGGQWQDSHPTQISNQELSDPTLADVATLPFVSASSFGSAKCTSSEGDIACTW